jgi:hypothetical protein
MFIVFADNGSRVEVFHRDRSNHHELNRVRNYRRQVHLVRPTENACDHDKGAMAFWRS